MYDKCILPKSVSTFGHMSFIYQVKAYWTENKKKSKDHCLSLYQVICMKLEKTLWNSLNHFNILFQQRVQCRT